MSFSINNNNKNIVKNYSNQDTNSEQKVVQQDNKLAKHTGWTVARDFARGQMTVDDVKNWCELKGVALTDLSNENFAKFEFTYDGKKYNFSCNKKACESATDDIKNSTVEANKLTKNYKFSDDMIAKYFDEAISTDGKKYYVLKSDYSEYKNASGLSKAVRSELKSKLMLSNFLNGSGTYISQTSGKVIEGGYDRTSDGTRLDDKNYAQYADEIEAASGGDYEKLKSDALQKLIKDFTSGNLNYTQTSKLLRQIGVEDQKCTYKNGNQIFTFEYNNKSYTITCNSHSANRGADDNTETTFTKDDLTKLGLSDDMINNYFHAASEEDGNIVSYTPNKAKASYRKNPENDIKALYALVGIKNDKYYTQSQYLKLNDYESMIKEILESAGDNIDVKALQDEAFDKYINDKASGKKTSVPYLDILDARPDYEYLKLGLRIPGYIDSHIIRNGNKYVIYQPEGIPYSTKKITKLYTYTKEQLINDLHLGEAEIRKYFKAAITCNGKTIKYAINRSYMNSDFGKQFYEYE